MFCFFFFFCFFVFRIFILAFVVKMIRRMYYRKARIMAAGCAPFLIGVLFTFLLLSLTSYFKDQTKHLLVVPLPDFNSNAVSYFSSFNFNFVFVSSDMSEPMA